MSSPGESYEQTYQALLHSVPTKFAHTYYDDEELLDVSVNNLELRTGAVPLVDDEYRGETVEASDFRLSDFTRTAHTEPVLSRFASLFRYINGRETRFNPGVVPESVKQATVDDDFWNGEVIPVVDYREETNKYVLGNSDYYTILSNHYRMVFESIDAVRGVSDDVVEASTPEYDDAVRSSTPVRDQYLPNVDALLDLSSYIRQASMIGATVVNTGDHYELLYMRRSDNVAFSPSMIASIPSGAIDWVDVPYSLVEGVAYKEFLEEFFSVENVLEGGFGRNTLDDEWNDIEEIDVHPISPFVDGVSGGVMYPVVLFIDNPEYVEFLFENATPNFETEFVSSIRLDEKGAVESLLGLSAGRRALTSMLYGVEYADSELGVDVADSVNIG